MFNDAKESLVILKRNSIETYFFQTAQHAKNQRLINFPYLDFDLPELGQMALNVIS